MIYFDYLEDSVQHNPYKQSKVPHQDKIMWQLQWLKASILNTKD